MEHDDPRALVSLLQAAYSGERAAALAYRGHWRSLPAGLERQQVRAIEADEWRHRALVGEILDALGAAPRRGAELRAALIGGALGLLCHEWDHEAVFRAIVLAHPLGRRLPRWPAPAPRAAIRSRFEDEARALEASPVAAQHSSF